MSGRRRTVVKSIAFLALAGAVATGLLLIPAAYRPFTPEGSKGFVDLVDRSVRSTGILGPILFVLLYGVGVMALPATPFNAAGALIFGKYAGAALNTVGATLGASASFLLGRFLFRDTARRFLAGRLADLDGKAERKGFPVVFYLRIVLFPFIVLNYAAGATRIRFSDFFWATLFGILPSVVVVSLLFGGLKEILADFKGPEDLFRFDILLSAALLLFSFFLPRLVGRFKTQRGAADHADRG